MSQECREDPKKTTAAAPAARGARRRRLRTGGRLGAWALVLAAYRARIHQRLPAAGVAYDNAAPLAPGDAEDPTAETRMSRRQLASVARLVAAHDPQLSRDAIGLGPSDRNAELLLTAPFDLSALTPPPRHNPTAETRMSRRALLSLLFG